MFSKLVRLGKDAELATTANGKQVCKIVAAYDVGWGDNKKTVWVDASWWGDRGSKIAQYLTKGTQIVIYADDIEPDAYQGKNGLQTKLKMNVTNVELVARSQQQPGQSYQQPQQSNRQSAQNYQAAQQGQTQQGQQAQNSEFNDFDDDIPFN
jgi:single-strand DNA-binding protein